MLLLSSMHFELIVSSTVEETRALKEKHRGNESHGLAASRMIDRTLDDRSDENSKIQRETERKKSRNNQW